MQPKAVALPPQSETCRASVGGHRVRQRACARPRQGRLHAFGIKTPNTIYNGPFLTREWRGSKFFAEPDEAQIDAGIELTLDICRRHKIDPVFYYPSTMYNYPRCFEVATILCHSNCRADKTDFCFPDWVYQKIEAAGIRLQS